MRGLGIVTQEQGKLFLVVLVASFLSIAIVVYGIAAMFEIVADGTANKKQCQIAETISSACQKCRKHIRILAMCSDQTSRWHAA